MSWIGSAIGVARRLAGGRDIERPMRTTELHVTADVEGALLSSAAALRRLGATITRYETEGGVLEARARGAEGSWTIKLTITGEGEQLARMRIESDVTGARRLFRRFRRELKQKGTT